MNVALINGSPNIRFIATPRTGTGPERVATFFDQVAKALTDPLTAKEKESGLYSPPPQPRIIFTGTLLDAQAFFQATTPVANCRNCPISKWTDGLPVVIPTEAAVKEMLTGTSHKPDELIKTQVDTSATTKAGTLIKYAGGYQATVEKVATIAVMAGCRPEYLPVVLAVATSGGGDTNCPGTSGWRGVVYVVSGPIAKEIGMNAGQDAMDVGNQANMSIQRSGELMTVDLGSCITGVSRTSGGSPVRTCFAEDVDGLPSGWEGFNEDSTYYKNGNVVNYTKNDDVLGKSSSSDCIRWWGFLPSSFRAAIGDGSGGLARALGVEGTPGPHNFLEWVAPMIYTGRGPAATFLVMHLNMAQSLYDDGFKKKTDVYNWLCNTYFVTKGDLYNNGWWDFFTNAGNNIEPTSGKAYKDLPNDYKIKAFGNTPSDNCIVVACSFADETCCAFITSGGKALPSYPIDPWK